LFDRVRDSTEVTWKAFPLMRPGEAPPPFRLANGVYYPNALESIVSTMETQVIGSRNAVALLARDLGVRTAS